MVNGKIGMRELDKQVAIQIMGLPNPTLTLFYTTRADADYCVLHKIRNDWDATKRQMFLGVLYQLFNERTKDPALLFMQYQPGDYSLAALETLRLML